MTQAVYDTSHWTKNSDGWAFSRADGVTVERQAWGNYNWRARRKPPSAQYLEGGKGIRHFKSAEAAMQAVDKAWPL